VNLVDLSTLFQWRVSQKGNLSGENSFNVKGRKSSSLFFAQKQKLHYLKNLLEINSKNKVLV